MSKFWTQQEEEILRKIYPLKTIKEILEQLPGRSWLAVSQHARKMKIERYRIRQVAKLKRVCGKYFSWYLRSDGYIQLAGKDIGPPKYKEFEHRYVWKTIKGKIPKDHEIHHIDGDRTNNNIDNLECIHRSKHHARDREIRESMTQFLKKKKLYQEWFQKENKGDK